MRIIAGLCKGTRLFMVPGTHVRPTSDRVKESLFQILMPYIQDAKILDLYGGTGALSLEALSRGALNATIVDSSVKSIKTIKKNIELTKFSNRCTVRLMDVNKYIDNYTSSLELGYDLIFLDPPYDKVYLLVEGLTKLEKNGFLKEGGLIITEYSSKENLPEKLGSLCILRELKYGSTKIRLYTNE